jgi:hypothetical protein
MGLFWRILGIEYNFRGLVMNNELHNGIERLEDVRFWLANLKHYKYFTSLQQDKLSRAYKIVNEVYDQFGQESFEN